MSSWDTIKIRAIREQTYTSAKALPLAPHPLTHLPPRLHKNLGMDVWQWSKSREGREVRIE